MTTASASASASAEERGAIASATAALDRFAFHRVLEGATGGLARVPADAVSDAPAADARDASARVLLVASTEAFRRLARLVPRPGERVVDVGSAYGDATALMARATGDASTVLGLDVAQQFVDAATRNHPDVRFARVDALEDPAHFARHLRGARCVFVDVGGVRPAEALVRLLPAVAKAAGGTLRAIVVKSEALARRADEEQTRDDGSSLLGFIVRSRREPEEGLLPEPPSGDNITTIHDPHDPPSAVNHPSPHAFRARLLPRAFWSDACAAEVPTARLRSAFKREWGPEAARESARRSNASVAFPRYPLKYPPRVFPDGMEACRFHNYAPEGCARARLGRCPMDHARCHWCGAEGHVARACAAAADAAEEAIVHEGLRAAKPPVREREGTEGTERPTPEGSSEGLAPTPEVEGVGRPSGTRSGNPENERASSERFPLATSRPTYLYVVGGRNRGKTVGVAERLDLTGPLTEWERAPRLLEPRGSHGLAAARGTLFAVAGGGVRSNLHTAEALRVFDDGLEQVDDLADDSGGLADDSGFRSDAAWRPAGIVTEARHAVAACATGDWGVYLVGGWGNGDACAGSVDFLNLRERDAFPEPGGSRGGEGGARGGATVSASEREAGSNAAPNAVAASGAPAPAPVVAAALTGGRGFAAGSGARRWRSLPPLLTPRKLHAAVGLSDGRLFVFGGRVADDPGVGPTASAEAYDPREGAWRRVADLPAGGACASAAVDVFVKTPDEASGPGGGADRGEAGARERIFVMTWGGDPNVGKGKGKGKNNEGKSASSSRCEVGALWSYDPDGDAYAEVAGLPLPEYYGFAAAAAGGWVYACGGSTRGAWTGAAHRIFVGEGGEGRGGEALPSMKMVRRRTAAAAV